MIDSHSLLGRVYITLYLKEFIVAGLLSIVFVWCFVFCTSLFDRIFSAPGAVDLKTDEEIETYFFFYPTEQGRGKAKLLVFNSLADTC